MKKIINVKNRFDKKTLLTDEKNYSNQMKNISSKITVLVSYSVYDSVGEIWFFIIEFLIAAMLNPSLKSRFM